VPGALDSPDHIEMAERLAGLVANGQTTLIEGAAHYPNMERPEDFHHAVTEFRPA
jgi:pimeloyl-ACP methyl ester carboxylesterase